MVPPIPPEANKEIEFVKSLVAKRFPVYDVRVSYDVVEFFCRVEPTTLDDNFELLRQDMNPHGYIPMIVYNKGEHVVTVAKKPSTKYRSIYVNVIMLVVTFIAMLFAGVLEWDGYADVPTGEYFSATNILTGVLVFTLPLMAILGVHELGHYVMARKHKVAASLPFFIPSIPPLGTFGAFISLRDPIPNRKALLEIGVAGPLSGLAVALPLAFIGLYLTNLGAKPVPDNVGSEGVVTLMLPLVYLGIENILPIQGDYLLHPTAFAAWVGFLVTALNLLPIGQLDGGHISRALLGQKAKYLTWVAAAAMVGLGLFYTAWLIFAMFILFLGVRHPPPLNDITKLDMKRFLVGVSAFVLLVVSFVPIPMSVIAADYSFEMTEIDGEPNNLMVAGESQNFTVVVNNTGNALNLITVNGESMPSGWELALKRSDENESTYADSVEVQLNSGENASLDIRIKSDVAAAVGTNYSVSVQGTSEGRDIQRAVVFNFTIERPAFSISLNESNFTALHGVSGNLTAELEIVNEGSANSSFNISVTRNIPQFFDGIVYQTSPTDPGAHGNLSISVQAGGNATVGIYIYFWSSAQAGVYTIYVDIYYLDTIISTLPITVTLT